MALSHASVFRTGWVRHFGAAAYVAQGAHLSSSCNRTAGLTYFLSIEHQMSGLFSSYLVDPVIRQARRQARRLSSAPSDAYDDERYGDVTTPAIESSSSDPQAPLSPNHDHVLEHQRIGSRRRLFPPPPNSGLPVVPYRNSVRSSNPLRNLLRQDTTLGRSQSGCWDAEEDGGVNNTSAAERRARHGSFGEPAMSGALPDNDGMRDLRNKIHQIREMAISSEEKAKRMHALMMADYETFKALRRPLNSRSKPSLPFLDSTRHPPGQIGAAERPQTPESAASSDESDVLHHVQPSDMEPTYHPPTPSSDDDDAPRDHGFEDSTECDQEAALGCKHYMRNVKIQCTDCRRWYTCKHCHDQSEGHKLDRNKVKSMLCMLCGYPQRAGDCCRQCGEQAAIYYCKACKLWENDPNKSIYHCDGCGICRRGEGIGKDYIHCNVSSIAPSPPPWMTIAKALLLLKRCNVCVSTSHADSHICVERATESDCPICGDYMFTSATTVVAMRCGHYIHRGCYDDYMQTSYKCPICNRSAVNMELQWRKLDHCIATQPMPQPYRNTKAWIICNDCSARMCTSYHWLGNKCPRCDSYNTNEVRLVDEPAESQDDSLHSSPSSARGRLLNTFQDTHPVLQSPSILSRPASDRSARLDENAASNLPATDRRGIIFSDPLTRPSELNSGESPQVHSTQWSADGVLVEHPQLIAPADPSSQHGPSQDILESDSMTDNSSDAVTEDGLNDCTSFWGESISPSSLVPTGWTSPRLFAASTASQDGHPADPSDSPGGGFVWPVSPSHWRLGSPRIFASNDGGDAEATSEAHSAWPINPSQWRLGSPRFFSSNDHDNAEGKDDEPPSGWPINPSQWRLGSPRLFNFGVESREREEDTQELCNREGGAGLRSGWLPNVTPGFLARRLSDWREENAVFQGDDSDDGSDEGSESDNSNDSNLQVPGTIEEEEEQDELDLIGHR